MGGAPVRGALARILESALRRRPRGHRTDRARSTTIHSRVIGVVDARFTGHGPRQPAAGLRADHDAAKARTVVAADRWPALPVGAGVRAPQGRRHAERAQAALQPLYHAILEREATDSAFSAASAETRKAFLAGKISVDDASKGHSGLRSYAKEPLLILMAIAGGVLLIVCANVANLLIARGAARQRELALRLAIGAGRLQILGCCSWRVVVLAAAGAAGGVLLASWGAASCSATSSRPTARSPSARRPTDASCSSRPRSLRDRDARAALCRRCAARGSTSRQRSRAPAAQSSANSLVCGRRSSSRRSHCRSPCSSAPGSSSAA